MSGQQPDLYERIESRQRSNRVWKTIALAASALLVLVFVAGLGISGVLVTRTQIAREQALRAEEAMQAERAARQEAEAAKQRADLERKKAEEAEQKARKAEKEAKEQARRAVYSVQLLLAQREYGRQIDTPTKGP